MGEEAWWGVAWAWVSGYSAISTLVTVFNVVIVFSVARNKENILLIRAECKILLTLIIFRCNFFLRHFLRYIMSLFVL